MNNLSWFWKRNFSKVLNFDVWLHMKWCENQKKSFSRKLPSLLSLDAFYHNDIIMRFDEANVVLSEPSKGNLFVTQTPNCIFFQFPCSKTNDCTPYEVTLPRWKYKFQVIGAAGGIQSGESAEIQGRGGYAEGIYKVNQNTQKFYVYIGGSGGSSTTLKGYNGGGGSYGSASPGGGATDIRTIGGAWDLKNSLESRLIVAGGGGGTRYEYQAGNGGGERGTQGSHLSETYKACIGTQKGCEGKVGDRSNEGTLGIGASADNWGENNGAGGGGGGYYGGGSAAKSAGSGGSGFVGKMLSPKLTTTSQNLGNGFAMISIYSNSVTCSKYKKRTFLPCVYIFIIK